MIEEAFERCQSEFDERVTNHMARQGENEDDARKRVYDNMLPTYRKALPNIFVHEMLWFHAMRKDTFFLFVKTTVSDLKLIEDYDNEEAWNIVFFIFVFVRQNLKRVRSAGIVRARR